MQDLNDKINNGGATAQGQLSADEWNELPSEVQNVIESVGQTLSGGDLTQLVKAIVSYSANGNFFADSGIADAYVLTAIGAKQGLYAYGDGSLVTFIPSFANTGAATVNVSTLGVKDIVNRLGIALAAGDINTAGEISLRYDLANDRFVHDKARLRTIAYRSGVQTLNSGAADGINFNAELLDTAGSHDNVTDNDKFFVPAGCTAYRVGCQLTFQGVAGAFFRNATLVSEGDSDYLPRLSTVSDFVLLEVFFPLATGWVDASAGDYVTLSGLHTKGTITNVIGDANKTFFNIEFR